MKLYGESGIKKIKGTIIASNIAAVFILMISAFIKGSMNPMSWWWGDRLVAVFVFAVIMMVFEVTRIE